MAINPDAAFSSGDLPRLIRALNARVDAVENGRSLESASIGAGGLSVKGGAIVIYDADGTEVMRLSTDGLSMEGLLQIIGEILVQGGGDITVDGGGSFRALNGSRISAFYADGSLAVGWGSFADDPETLEIVAHGVLVQDNESGNGEDVFRAVRLADGGEKVVGVGSDTEGTPNPVDELIMRSLLTRIRSYGGGDAFFTVFDGGNAVVNAQDGGSAALNVSDPGGDVLLINTDFRVFTAYENTGNAANCHLLADGQIMRVSSSRRFKTDIRDAEIDADAVLRLQPRTWLPADEVAGYAGAPAERIQSDAPQERKPRKLVVRKTHERGVARAQTRQVGFVAEELDDLGLDQFVEHDENGEAGSIAYDRLTAALVTLCQRQQGQIDALERRVDALSGQNTDR